MAIKNWTVTAEGIKSAAARELYFNDMNHPNHVNTESTIDIIGSNKSTLKIIAACEMRKLNLAMSKRGGRPPNEAQEFVFTLPKGAEFRTTPDVWKNMIVGVLRDMCSYLNAPKPIWGEDEDGKRVKVGEEMPERKVSLADFNGLIRATVHQQDQEGRGSGDHAHVMIGSYLPQHEMAMPLNSKGLLHTLKTAFNKQVKDQLGICNSEYVAKKKYEGVAKKRVPKWKVDAAILSDDLDGKKREIRNEVNKNQFVIKPEITKITNKLEKQLDRLNSYMEEGNIKRALATGNRIDKTLNEAIGVQYQDDAFMQSIQDAKDKLEKTRQQVQNEKVSNQKPKNDTSKTKY